MSDATKAGVAGGGALVMAGALFARCGDDVVRGGLRQGTRLVDDVAVGATPRMAEWGAGRAAQGTVDDAVRVGAGGADDAVRGLTIRGAGGARVHGTALGDDLLAAGADDAPWFDAARDLGVDVGIELVSFDREGPPPKVVTTPGEVRCPRRVEVSRAPEAWDELLRGIGVACAPVVVVGTARADGQALRVGADDVPLPELAQACADLDVRCVLVGCPAAKADACADELEESLLHTRLQPSLPAYVRGFVGRALAQEVPPVVIAQLAAVDGDTMLVIARPDAVGS